MRAATNEVGLHWQLRLLASKVALSLLTELGLVSMFEVLSLDILGTSCISCYPHTR